MMDLFSSEYNTDRIALPLRDAEIYYYPNFLNTETASTYFEILQQQTDWQQDPITLFGKTYLQPRLTALYAINDKPYSYSGIRMFPKPMTPTLLTIKDKIETVSEVKFTTALLNLYRNGKDSNGWHSDDEKELGKNPVIASISLGVARRFKLRHKHQKDKTHSILLEHGSLLLMQGETQHFWKHQLPKSNVIHEARINITYRVL